MKVFSVLILLSGALTLSACAVSAEYPKDQRPSYVITGAPLPPSKAAKESASSAPAKDGWDDICTSEEDCTCSSM